MERRRTSQSHEILERVLTIEATKFIANQCILEESEKDLDACNAKVMTCFESADYIEGRRAFMEKRIPIFEGK